MSCVLRPLPQYRRKLDPAHRVCALRIRDIALTERGMLIIPWEPNMPSFEVSAEWVALKEPHAGGYWISYQDGSAGFLMAELFEKEYEQSDL